MSTDYEKKYPTYIVTPPSDVADGSHTTASLEKHLQAERDSLNEKAASTATSVFDDGKPNGVPQVA